LIHSFCGQKGCTQMFFRKISPPLMSIFFILFLRVQISLPYKIMGQPVQFLIMNRRC
jgi:hypothetical protein